MEGRRETKREEGREQEKEGKKEERERGKEGSVKRGNYWLSWSIFSLSPFLTTRQLSLEVLVHNSDWFSFSHLVMFALPHHSSGFTWKTGFLCRCHVSKYLSLGPKLDFFP